MRRTDNLVRVTDTVVSWSDATFNPWLSGVRCLGSATNFSDSLIHGAVLGDPTDALAWNYHAAEFGATNRRRRRVFAGPWCWPLSPGVDSGQSVQFWQLVSMTGGLDWLVLCEPAAVLDAGLPIGWGQGPQNVWVGAKASGPERVASTLSDLRHLPAKVKFIVTRPSLGDLGDLDLRGVDWVIISMDPLAIPECAASIKLQAMAYGVPVWFDWPATCGTLEGSAGAFGVQEHPRVRR